jgi:molecular chaperone HscC
VGKCGLIIGIDLGTTNCACAIFRNGSVEMIPNSLGHLLTPSAVSIDDKGSVITGLTARERQSTHPRHTITAFKRYMGTNHVTTLGDRSFKPEELSALMLASMKRDAEAYLGEPVSEAVITVPAYFNDKQRNATRQAGLLAGLKVERLINEPTAAALAYGIHQRDRPSRFLVFDLGGGTFDVSILEIFEGIIEVRASAGDNRLGGEDFNAILIDMARRQFGERLEVNADDRDAMYQKLREAAERTRRQLTDGAEAAFSVVWKDKAFDMKVTSDAFERECEALLARMREPVLRSMRDSQVSSERLDEIVLVGGATRMPIVRRAVTKMFGRFPSATINPDEAVARGAAVQAALKARDAALSEVVLTDVCPYTLGVQSADRSSSGAIVGGIFSPLIERNSVIPASRENIYTTLGDNMELVEFLIYQGESRWVKDNVYLGKVSIPIPRKPAGQVIVTCRFSYDINGLLEVDLYVPETKQSRQLVIVDREGVDPGEIEARRAELAKLKVHPRDTDAVRATVARAGRCYENAIGPLREEIGRAISEFEGIVEKQDPRAIDAARTQMHRFLDSSEGEAFL